MLEMNSKGTIGELPVLAEVIQHDCRDQKRYYAVQAVKRP
jgi:hypothetical protein